MKKTLKIISIVVAVALVAVIMFYANAFVGNPISKMLVTRNSNKYIEENYSELQLDKEIMYDFKMGAYCVQLSSSTVEDLHFTLYYRMNGKLGRDLYENNITEGRNVLYRLNEDYRHITDEVFEELETNGMFVDTDSFFSYAWLVSKEELNNMPVGFEDLDGGIDGTTLVLDKKYNVAELGKIGGWVDIDVRFSGDDESYEKGVEAIREIKRVFDEKGIGFYYISFGMFNAEGNHAYRVDYLPYSQIDDENLADILKTMNENNPIDYGK